MPLYRIKPNSKSTPPTAHVTCESCGKLLGTVGWRVDVGILVPASYVLNRWDDLAEGVRQHENDCPRCR